MFDSSPYSLIADVIASLNEISDYVVKTGPNFVSLLQMGFLVLSDVQVIDTFDISLH